MINTCTGLQSGDMVKAIFIGQGLSEIDGCILKLKGKPAFENPNLWAVIVYDINLTEIYNNVYWDFNHSEWKWEKIDNEWDI
jgi:hypothetical protein